MCWAFFDQLGGVEAAMLAWPTAAALGLLWGAGVSSQVLALCREGDRPGDVADLVRLSVLAGSCLPVLAVARAIRWRPRAGRAATAAGRIS